MRIPRSVGGKTLQQNMFVAAEGLIRSGRVLVEKSFSLMIFKVCAASELTKQKIILPLLCSLAAISMHFFIFPHRDMKLFRPKTCSPVNNKTHFAIRSDTKCIPSVGEAKSTDVIESHGALCRRAPRSNKRRFLLSFQFRPELRPFGGGRKA